MLFDFPTEPNEFCYIWAISLIILQYFSIFLQLLILQDFATSFDTFPFLNFGRRANNLACARNSLTRKIVSIFNGTLLAVVFPYPPMEKQLIKVEGPGLFLTRDQSLLGRGL